MVSPRRGEIWLADLDPVRGHEQAGRRPVLVVSDNRFNASMARLVYAVPLTTRDRGLPYHVALKPDEGGLRQASFAMCEHMRSLSRDRLVEYWGAADAASIAQVEDGLRVLLCL